MPVHLPPYNNVVNLPTAPQDPPDDHDVRAAHEYVKSTEIAWGNNRLDNESHVVAAMAYEHTVLAAYCGGAAAPPWFANALKEGLQDALKEILQDIKDIKEEINTIKDDSLAAKSHNLQCGDGSARDFESLPFRDGKEPSAQVCPRLQL
ncbi:hypothetical protein B0H15DRAFT_1028030 [Mycena belliarum]|uniref:Uncharacterized protein n=1 Tax=Mycena belliarum TaxID=1033014 RepID=A0AAD6TR19_9AGAR|nr:hypothetical protein B0H15DRAFT_1028030 [Mycena belliae]